MDHLQPKRPDFWTITLAVTLGVFGGNMLTDAMHAAEAAYALQKVGDAFKKATQDVELPSPASSERHPSGHWVTEIVEGQSREACLAYTHGVANEQYQKCRDGFR